MLCNSSFYKLNFIYKFLREVQEQKQKLFDELVVFACDKTLCRRRIRMLVQLTAFENQILQKIQNAQIDNPADLDFENFEKVMDELSYIYNRSS